MRELGNRLDCLFEPLEQLEGFQKISEALRAPGVCGMYGPDDAQRAHLIAGLVRRLARPAMVVVSSDQAAMRMAEDLGLLLDGRVRILSGREVSFLKAAASSREITMRRLEALGDCLSGKAAAVVVPADALLHRLMPAERFREHIVSFAEGDTVEPADLAARLAEAGYERVHMVEGRGQCALRGGILDVYPIGEANALRVEFFDDEIDSIRSFDIMTQRSVSRRERAVCYPASEMLLDETESGLCSQKLQQLLQEQARYGAKRARQLETEFGLSPLKDFLEKASADPDAVETARQGQGMVTLRRNFAQTLDALNTRRLFEGADSLVPVLMDYSAWAFDYLEEPIIVLDQPERLRERAVNRFEEFKEQFTAALEHNTAVGQQGLLLRTWDAAVAALAGRSVLLANPFMRTERDFTPGALVSVESRNATGYQSNVRELARDLDAWRKGNWRVALLAGGDARGERLEKALAGFEQPARFVPDPPRTLDPGVPIILPVTLNRGFLYPSIRFAIISESDIYGVNRKKTRSRASSGEKISAFTQLRVGDYVVHENHGIGQYMGTVRLNSEGTYRDFLHIRYQGSDKLYVPADQLDRVQKYIGSDGDAPKLNRLSGGDWQRQKSRVKQSIREIAGDLLKLYAQRESLPGYAFAPDTPWQQEFEDNFPFEETPDQITAIEDIKRDMESPKIMDRLLCGDVGYGKTEVALRAIFKAVMSGKQAAMLAPTTILVQQHYATMLNRFAGFPIRVEVLSRFKTKAEQKEILKSLEAGEIDVVVGTHRLLAKDIHFKNLGLLVVDEEQRFGVTHKEKIKQMKQSVDVLTLTATPIPRTLHMSMVGIRDMSLLQSPPEERYPVQTYVVEYSDGLVRDAILRELARGGQVYMLYNRVQTIEVMFARLKKLVPEARIAVGHGQMREHALEDVMLDFYDGKFDVLLCTTIIEAGLDVPRANTLIVCDADRFGLSQLYQLRGRVGRSNRLAYAYLTVDPSKVLTESADQRLAAIREFTEFGSGFRVAMRDLEIRGAGNLLGSEQSGFMMSVGYDLYVKMIEETVRELRGDHTLNDIDTRVDLKVDAYLPSEYVPNELLRMEMYKKIAAVHSKETYEDLVDELIDRFGDPARPVMNLIDIAYLRAMCARLGIDYVTCRSTGLVMRFSMAADIDLVRVLTAVRKSPLLKLQGGNPPSIVLPALRQQSQEELMRQAAGCMEAVIAAYDAQADADEPKTAAGGAV